VEWEVRRTYQGTFYPVNNYFTWAEAWDNSWYLDFKTQKEAVDFARKHAQEAKGVMLASHKKHGGRADPYEIAAVVNKGRYEPPPPQMGSKDEPTNPFNKIGHVSDWDGTLRSYKALYAIKRFHPHNPGDIARIWIEERNDPADMFQVQFPMFLEIPELVEFVTDSLLDQMYDRYFNYYMTHWDLTDSIADMWKLSPVLKMNYPGHIQMFSGVNIGEGWQEILRSVRKILDR
jgi:hypothetical protein